MNRLYSTLSSKVAIHDSPERIVESFRGLFQVMALVQIHNALMEDPSTVKDWSFVAIFGCPVLVPPPVCRLVNVDETDVPASIALDNLVQPSGTLLTRFSYIF